MSIGQWIKGWWRNQWYKLLRGAVVAAVAAGWAKMETDPKYLAFIPVIMMIGKAIRDKKPEWAWIVPF